MCLPPPRTTFNGTTLALITNLIPLSTNMKKSTVPKSFLNHAFMEKDGSQKILEPLTYSSRLKTRCIPGLPHPSCGKVKFIYWKQYEFIASERLSSKF